MVHFQSMDGAWGMGECSLRLSAPRTAWRMRCSRRRLIFFHDGADDHARGFLGALGNPALQRHEGADELRVRFDVLEHLRLEQKLGQPLALDSVVLGDGDNVFLEIVANVAQPFGKVRSRRTEAGAARAAAWALVAGVAGGFVVDSGEGIVMAA